MDENVIHFTDGTTLTHIGQVVKGKNTAMLHCITSSGELKYIVPSINIKYIETGEIKEVDGLDWDKAITNVIMCRALAEEIDTGVFYVNGCNELLNRYAKGDRTQVLYDEMMGVH